VSDEKEEIRSRADIVSVVGRFVPLKRRGTYWVGRCPFHDDHSPSLHVNPQLGIYKCFVCGAGGDIFKFLMEHEHLGFREVLESLARETGVELPERSEGTDPEEARRTAAARQALDWARDHFHKKLLETPAALEYARRRGILDSEIADFRLGFAPEGNPLLEAAPVAGVSRQALLDAGLVTAGDSGSLRDRFRLRLVFPLLDPSQRPIGFAGRNLRSGRPDIPKYLNSPETSFYHKSRFLFGLSHARSDISRKGEAVIVEGYMDWFALWRHGLRNAVAASGTAFTRDQARLLARSAKRVVCFFDADRAGLAAAERSLPVLLAEGMEVRMATLGLDSEAKDPDEYLKIHGPKALADRIAAATHWSLFLLGAAGNGDLGLRPDEQAALVRRVEALADSIPDEQSRSQCRESIHQIMKGMDSLRSSNWSAVRNPKAVPLPMGVQPTGLPQLPKGHQRAEAQLVHLLCEHPSLTLDIQDRLHPSRLEDPRCREILDRLYADSEVRSGVPEPSAVAASLEQPLADFMAGLFQLFPVRLDELASRAWLSDFLRDLDVREVRSRRRRLALSAQLQSQNQAPLQDYRELLAAEQQISEDSP
jgi:DNA primase catalytic core